MIRMAKKDTRRGSRHKDRNPVSLPSNYHEALKALAARHARPITWELRLAVRAYLAKHGVPLPADPELAPPSGESPATKSAP